MTYRLNLAAYTVPSGSFPPYVTVNAVSDCIEISVRSPATDVGPGSTSCVTMTKEAFTGFLKELVGHHTVMHRMRNNAPVAVMGWSPTDKGTEDGA